MHGKKNKRRRGSRLADGDAGRVDKPEPWTGGITPDERSAHNVGQAEISHQHMALDQLPQHVHNTASDGKRHSISKRRRLPLQVSATVAKHKPGQTERGPEEGARAVEVRGQRIFVSRDGQFRKPGVHLSVANVPDARRKASSECGESLVNGRGLGLPPFRRRLLWNVRLAGTGRTAGDLRSWPRSARRRVRCQRRDWPRGFAQAATFWPDRRGAVSRLRTRPLQGAGGRVACRLEL